MNILSGLNKPYPRLENKWKAIVFISLFITFFMVVFKPFGLQFVNLPQLWLRLMGYGIVTFLVLLFNLQILPNIFHRIFNEKHWTVKRQIAFLIWIVISISIGNYLYSVAMGIMPWYGFYGFFLFLAFTAAVALIPIIGVTVFIQNNYLKKHLAVSQQINSTIKSAKDSGTRTENSLVFGQGNQKFTMQTDKIVYMESEGNYIHIYYVQNEGLKSELVRETIKHAETVSQGTSLFRCHRAYIVNTSFVEKVNGNSQGFLLRLTHTDCEIPVSRTYTKAFREFMNHTNR